MGSAAAELDPRRKAGPVAQVFGRKGSVGPDVILVDMMGITTDYLAYQLARRGARVHLYTPSLRWPPSLLRAAYPYRSLLRGPLGSEPSDSFAALVEKVNPACIIPQGEAALYWMWNQPAHIQERCLPRVAPAIRPLLLDRALLLEEAADWGIATPEAMYLNSYADCRAATSKGLPVMVKAGQSNASSGVALCRTPDEVVRAFGKFSCLATSVTAQRYYVGPTYMAGGLFQRGEAVHFYAGEQTGMWPPLIGYSCEIKSVGDPHFSILMQAAETVCKNLEWTGLAAFDFVLDEGGEFRFVDFNPRIWGSASAAVASKVDLYDGIDRLIRGQDAGPPSRSIPGITHRIFPKYTLKPSGASMWRRLAGLRSAPWDTPFLVASELVFQTALNVMHSLDKHRERYWAAP